MIKMIKKGKDNLEKAGFINGSQRGGRTRYMELNGYKFTLVKG